MVSGCMPSKKRTRVVLGTHSLRHVPHDHYDPFFQHAKVLFPVGPSQSLFLCLLSIAPFSWLMKSHCLREAFRDCSQEESHSIIFYSCIFFLVLQKQVHCCLTLFCLLYVSSCLHVSSRKSRTLCFLFTAISSVSRTVPAWLMVFDGKLIS